MAKTTVPKKTWIEGLIELLTNIRQISTESIQHQKVSGVEWFEAKDAALERLRAKAVQAAEGPFILTTDNDGHHYIIPKAKSSDWDKWLGLSSEDVRSWNPPKYARAIGGSPSLVSFDTYTLE